jgi:hypothetical protein
MIKFCEYIIAGTTPMCIGLSTGALLVIAWRLGEISIWLQGM